MEKPSKCRVGILGDSISTYKGYIPQTNTPYYPKPEKVPDITCVEETWWHQLCSRMGWEMQVNDSFSGATVCKAVRPTHTQSAAFVNRMKESLCNRGTDDTKFDVIFIFGGTNDDWLDRDIGKVKFGDWSDQDLFSIIPAYCYLLDYVTKQHPAARIVCILNDVIRPEIKEGIFEATKHYKVGCVDLVDINTSWKHPTKLGMQEIANQVEAYLKENREYQ